MSLEAEDVLPGPSFAPRPHLLGSEEVGVLRGLRWWTLDELEATAEDLAPADLPALVRNLVAYGPPERPIEVGV